MTSNEILSGMVARETDGLFGFSPAGLPRRTDSPEAPLRIRTRMSGDQSVHRFWERISSAGGPAGLGWARSEWAAVRAAEDTGAENRPRSTVRLAQAAIEAATGQPPR